MMGMQQTVSFANGQPPSWAAVHALLQLHGIAAQLRMINGELAFPDEAPPEPWQELRIGTPDGMTTVRNEQGRYVFVTWGNADAAQLQAWNTLTWAFAEAGHGVIDTEEGKLSPAQFLKIAELLPTLRPA